MRGSVGSGEHINALWLVTAAACVFIIAYRLYGSFVAAKVMALDDAHKTPVDTMAALALIVLSDSALKWYAMWRGGVPVGVSVEAEEEA